ncbi:Hsp70 family protein [Noviherbaspirillum sp. UKPF54]|uniref:Hsp70 family protein n=1 Tax=Noviherbaspirillum sp. UKPF54 TaxID=2601898 RepID=UPI00143D424E|nr:Hsp70 family protein [Noviherbaspirillum sp. UKPF54]
MSLIRFAKNKSNSRRGEQVAIFGFDFGTTNSLASVVIGDTVLTFLDNDQPIPSVVSFEGGKVEVGRKARDKLTSAGLGVQGSTVRSPKSLLGKDELIIDGVRRDPVQMVEYVLEYVRRFVLQNKAARDLKMDRVVATIPVNMEGRRRALLRQAFRQAGMNVVQFVHEPLAALYGFLRSSENGNDLVKRFNGKLLLVFDWGGGTLDLTLCRVLDGLLVQVANDGTDDVGGDVFDEELRNEVEKRSRAARGFGDDVELLPDARKRLLHACEQAKISLSGRGTWNVYVEHYYDVDGDSDLEVKLSRDDLDSIVGHLVRKGVARIERLLEREGYSTASVELCLATGGMVNMPLVKNRLDELFGPGRVHVSKRSASAIAEGAAWVAHDEARLHLAKNVELVMARNAYVPLLTAGVEMPLEREIRQERFSLYCVDPSDGFGKFSLVSPHRPGPRVLPDDPRRPLSHMLLKVDGKAQPFRERLELQVTMSEDLVLTAEAWSLNQKGRAAAEVHDLEFALATPGTKGGWLKARTFEAVDSDGSQYEQGGLALRSNLANREDLSLVPGEVLYGINPFYFRREQCPPQVQVDEHLYYQPCSICRRASNDPLCRCASTPQRPPHTDMRSQA